MEALEQYYSSLVTEKDHPFTECATFGDDIKGKGYSFQADWHYTNQPYLDEPGTTLSDFTFTEPTINVTQALTDLTAFLKGEIKAEDSTYMSQIADKFSYESDQRSFALRLIIHYAGDIAQPLHSTALVDSKYPSGDRGGNSEKIPSKSGASNLHAVWDSVLYKYTGRPKLPLSDSDWTWYTSEVAELAKTYPVDTATLHGSDFAAWANDSFVLAETLVYPGKNPPPYFATFI